MGPRPKARKKADVGSDDHGPRLLQWGRARRRGRRQVHALRAMRMRVCFNGAAPEGAEELESLSDLRHFCHRFNGAAPEGAEERSRARPRRLSLRPAFNGAAPEGAEELGRFLRFRSFLRFLQWGRARRRGRTKLPRDSRKCDDLPFNGAAPEGAEERATCSSLGPPTLSFNGAAPEGAEELGITPRSPENTSPLQWGRARRRGRTPNPVRYTDDDGPSMGPRPKARKNDGRWIVV